MAKRGEKRPWKVQWEWSSGIKGTTSHTSRDDAETQADRIRQAGENREDEGLSVTVKVFNKDAQHG